MYRTNKKRFLTVLTLLIATILLMGLQADAVFRWERIDNTEYSSEDIPTEKLEQIIMAMYGSVEPNNRNIFCIFGHSKATGGIRITEHNYYSTVPKCKATTYEIEYCTRNGCDYFVVTNESSIRVGCCP